MLFVTNHDDNKAITNFRCVSGIFGVVVCLVMVYLKGYSLRSLELPEIILLCPMGLVIVLAIVKWGREFARKISIPEPLTPEIKERLLAVGVHENEFPLWRERYWAKGGDVLERWIESLGRELAETRLWTPILREFAAKCRQLNPADSPSLNSRIGQAQHRVVRERMLKLKEENHFLTRRNPEHVILVSTSQNGLTAAADIFASDQYVVLTEDEVNRWSKESKRGPCYPLIWCNLTDTISESGKEFVESMKQQGQLNELWNLEHGVIWGMMSGGGHSELWDWDGQHFVMVGEYQRYVF